MRTCLFLLAGAFMASCAGNSKQGQTAEDYLGYNPDEQQLLLGDDIAIAQTQYGKVKGYILRVVYTLTWVSLMAHLLVVRTVSCLHSLHSLGKVCCLQSSMATALLR